MRKIMLLLGFSCLVLFGATSRCETSSESTSIRYDLAKGSIMSIDLSVLEGFEIGNKKPKVWLTSEAREARRKACKVLTYDALRVTCELATKVPVGQYSAMIQSGRDVRLISDKVFVRRPAIDSITCSPNVPTTLTVTGKYFGTDAKVYLEEINAKGKLKHWRIAKNRIAGSRDGKSFMEPSSGESEISFVIPQNIKNWTNGFVTVKNAVGFDQKAIARDVDDYMIVNLTTGIVTTQADAPADLLTNDAYKTTSLVLRKIKAGVFTMGSPEDELGRISNETQHDVTLTDDFYIGVFELTQNQFEQVTTYNPSMNVADMHPVENVTWDEARGGDWPVSDTGDISPAADSFLGLLRILTGRDFDLPTEAQWEYACRATTTTALNSGENLTSVSECPNMDAVGWYYYNSGGSHQIVGTVGTAFATNLWGLYDMHGNVWEWCLDWYEPELGEDAVEDPTGPDEGKMRVRRSGRWNNYARSCRSASRTGGNATYHWSANGLRIALTVD